MNENKIKLVEVARKHLENVKDIPLKFYSYDKGQLLFEGEKGKYSILTGCSYSNLQQCGYIDNNLTLKDYYNEFDILIINKNGEKVYEKYL